MSILPSTHQNNLQILRGIAKFAPRNADGSKQSAIQMSPSSEFAIALSTEDSSYVSAESGVNEVLDRTVISVDRTGSLTCNNLSNEIKALFIVGDSVDIAQSASTVTAEVTAHVFPNRSIQLGGPANNGTGVFGVSAVTVSIHEAASAAAAAADTAYAVGDVVVPATANTHWYMAATEGTTGAVAPTFPTDGSSVADGAVTWQDMGEIPTVAVAATDYELDADYAIINVPATGALAEAFARVPAAIRAAGKSFRLSVDYTLAAKTVPQIATKGDATLEGEFFFYEQNPKGHNSVWYAPSATLSPNGDFSLKSGSDYGAVGFGVAFQKPPVGAAIYINGVPS